jgi:nicotinamidase-related amidase
MPLTKLDANAALVVIDLQKGIAGLPTIHPASEMIGRAARLARAFRERSLPVVLVRVTGSAPGRTDAGVPNIPRPADWADLVPELEQQPSDCVITKQRWGAFLGTSLDEYLRQRAVTQIFLAGIATSIGVESTARSAFDLGYNVVLVVDAMTDRNADAHQNSVERIFPRLGEIDSTENVLQRLRG